MHGRLEFCECQGEARLRGSPESKFERAGTRVQFQIARFVLILPSSKTLLRGTHKSHVIGIPSEIQSNSIRSFLTYSDAERPLPDADHLQGFIAICLHPQADRVIANVLDDRLQAFRSSDNFIDVLLKVTSDLPTSSLSIPRRILSRSSR
jgi:hypothetical protein